MLREESPIKTQPILLGGIALISAPVWVDISANDPSRASGFRVSRVGSEVCIIVITMSTQYQGFY
ncbi:hypothetical protein LB506_002436 [Fusarium annulatum]|nr:hypothetical protein LB506_002436 [Fusarium annulatum]